MLKRHNQKQLATIVFLTACLLVGCAVTSFMHGGAARSGAALNSVAPKVKIRWQSHGPSAEWMAFSSNGRSFCTLAHSMLSVYSLSGIRRYSVKLSDANRAAVAGEGEFALAYSAHDPTNTTLTFLDSKGRVYWKVNVSGAVWCADGCPTREGSRFVVGTGNRHIYVFDIGKGRKSYRRWRAAGAVVSIGIDQTGDEISYGTWQQSTIGQVTVRGRRIWQMDAEPASLHFVRPLAASGLTMVRAIPNRIGANGTYFIVDEGGNTVLRGIIDAEEHTNVLCAPNGQYVCIGYKKTIEHKGKLMSERRAAILDASGKLLCEKGSTFFQAEVFHVTSGGYALVGNGKGGLFTMSPSGDMRPATTPPAPVRQSVSSKDGSRMLLQCRDGNLCLLDISQ